MSIEVKNEYGKIDITNDVIAQIVGEQQLNVTELLVWLLGIRLEMDLQIFLEKKTLRGVIVRSIGEATHIDMYVIIGYGTKISEVAYQVQSKVKYTLKKTVGLNVESINIFVQGVRVTNF